MIPEIGIMIGVFILANLIPSRWRLFAVGFRAAAFLVAAVVVVDLGVRGLSDQSLASLIVRRAEAPPPDVPAPALLDGAEAQAPPTYSVTTGDGGSIRTDLGYGISVSKGSSLNREWIALHDSALPVDLEGTPGVRTVYKSKKYRGEYRYRADFTLLTRAAVRAVQVRFLTFDVWGNHGQTLSFEEVIDIPADSSMEFSGEWSLYSEADVARHYASIAYVASVRLADGSVLFADTEPVLAEARKFFARFTAADLDPKEVRKDGPIEGTETR